MPMKRLMIIAAMLLVITSCEKEDDPQLLSDFITANVWETIITNNEPVVDLTYIAEFLTDGTYTLSITDGTTTLSASGGYSVNNQVNTLTLDQPEIGEMPEDPTLITFDVEWTEGIKQMSWTDVDDPDEVVIVWTEH